VRAKLGRDFIGQAEPLEAPARATPALGRA
jgi:hypothetical protein